MPFVPLMVSIWLSGARSEDVRVVVGRGRLTPTRSTFSLEKKESSSGLGVRVPAGAKRIIARVWLQARMLRSMNPTMAANDMILSHRLVLFFMWNPLIHRKSSPRESIHRVEHFFGDIAEGADPVFGEVFEFGAGFDAAGGVAFVFVVDVAAVYADVTHGLSFC